MRQLVRLGVILVAVATLHATARAETTREVLPSNVVPLRYDLSLKPDAQALTFSGDVGITVDVRSAAQDVTLNADGLVFDGVRADGLGVATVSLDPAKERATLHFARALAPGAHHLAIAYHGKIGRSTLGFFAMDYDTARGPRRTLATNFEPASARRLLPCWDEPARKAVFAVTADAPADRMVVSNMPAATIAPLGGGMQRVSFAPTPKMSTYLLYVGIGDWERIHTTADGVDVGVVVSKGDAEKGRYALAQAASLLHWYDGYFGTPYPLPKLDLIVAPGAIAGGSMENWGAIFYSQEHLLLDPLKGTPSDRQLVFEVVAHEMSHQWFGDLVTMQWWDSLWLNEGFARWMQSYVADALHPEWRTGLQAQGIFERGKAADAEVSTHPVLQPVDTVEQAADAFDDITYDKGAAVITMLASYVGEDRFREGVRRYMKAHAYGNTVDTDLWSIMQEAVGKPILKVEADFTRQAGLPLVRVTPSSGGLQLREDRFYADAKPDRTKQRWSLPLTVAPATSGSEALLLEDETTLRASDGALVNAGQTGYARTLYDPKGFKALLPRVPKLAAVDQLGLLNDAYALGLAGYAPASRTLAVIARLPVDADPIVWRRVTGLLLDLDARFPSDAGRKAFCRFVRGALAPVAARLGRDARPGEDANASKLREQLLPALARCGDQGVIAWATARWDDAAAPAADRRTALDVYAASADRPAFDRLLAQAASTTDPLEKVRLYQAMAGTAAPQSARKLLDVALDGAMPTGSNFDVILTLAVWQPDLVWREAIPRLDSPQAAMTANYQRMAVGLIVSGSADPARVAELDAYVRTKVPESARRPFAGYAAAVVRNGRIERTIVPELRQWVNANGG